MYTKNFRLLRLFTFVLVIAFSLQEVQAQDGEKLFKQNCASCHKTSSQKLTGPGLEGVMNRVPSEEWLIKWVKNSQELIKQGDPYAVDIFNEYNKTIMPPQPLSDEEILAIMDYVESAPHAKEETGDPFAEEVVVEEDKTIYWWLILGIVFLLVIKVLGSVNYSLKNIIREKKGLPPVPDRTYMESLRLWISHHRKHTALILILLLVIGSSYGWDALMGIGVYQGYKPEQPIQFSHEIHAGQNQINCVYCHFGAEKSKTAGVPPVNVCMNCHTAIQSGSLTGQGEIAKIYEAAGWNPETQEYDKPQKPIKWVRVHNLPDFSYFNHSQHVIAGKIECQTCHGQVSKMDVAEQHSELTMGWCVNCHRNTEVDIENEYYQDLYELHETIKAGKHEETIKKWTVEDIGGLECAKCHY